MAKALPAVWGIDIGQCALKALRLELVDGKITATAFDYIEHPKILSQPDADPDELTRAALEQFLSRNDVRGDEVAISVAGQTGLARFVKLPPVEPKKIPDIVKFEAKQQIPFPLEEVVWDYQLLGGSAASEDFVENEVGIFAMKRETINNYLQVFRELKVELHYIQMAPLALCNYVGYDVLGRVPPAPPKKGEEPPPPAPSAGCALAIDIGVDNTSLVVTDGEKVIWQRPIPIGGNHFTRALTKDLKLTFAKAEHLKRNATKAPDPKKIFQCMRPVFNDFVGEVQRSLGFFTSSHRGVEIKRFVGLGNAFKLPGLQKFISQSLSVELEKPTVFERLGGDEVLKSPAFTENTLSFAVSYGLAVQGLKMGQVKTNLLPQELITERLVRAKKPWLAAAAASLFIGVATYAFFIGAEYQQAEAAEKAAEGTKGTPGKAGQLDSEYKKAQEEYKKAYEDSALIVQGSRERPNWLQMNRYLNECIPQSDGTNLPRDPIIANRYWNDDAKRAYENDKEYRATGRKDESHDPENLIQVDIHGIFFRYCTVGMATDFFNNAKELAYRESTTGDPDWEKAPDKEGWVVEIRGYTFHHRKQNFISETLVHNLRNGPYAGYENRIRTPLDDPSGKWTKIRISHVALLEPWEETEWNPTTSPSPPGFKLLQSSPKVNELVRPAAAGGAATTTPNPSPQPNTDPTGSEVKADRSRDWRGLGTGVLSADAGGQRGGGRGFNRPTPQPGIGRPGARPAAQPEADEGKTITRTEFIVVFYWREPLPTETGEELDDEDEDVEGKGVEEQTAPR